MKHINYLLAILTIVLLSCNKNEVSFGSLHATVYLDSVNGQLINNSRISLASSQNDLGKGNMILSDVMANPDGIITIPELNPGKYYYECIATQYGGGVYYGTGSFTIREGQASEIDIILSEQ